MAGRKGGKAARKRATLAIAEADLYSTEEAADYLGYSVGGIRKLASLKKLHPIKIGRDLQFFKKDLDEYNEKRRRPRGRPVEPIRSQRQRAVREQVRLRVRRYRAKNGKKK